MYFDLFCELTAQDFTIRNERRVFSENI